jgi:two-component sensor histidine kinase
MGELCKQLRYAHRENQHVDLSFRADHCSLPVDLAVPLALFIVEAVTNSFRHAFPTNAPGKIEMTFALVGDKAILSIEDNGQGYDVNAGLARNMGTQLMQGFASQLNGTVTFISDRNMGSSTTLHFPVTALS